MFNYCMPTNIRFGKGCLAKLSETLKAPAVRNILIFTGNKSAKISGALKYIEENLPAGKVRIFEDIKPNPTIDSLKDGVDISKKNKIDLIIAVGGGSVIDYGKAVAVLSKEKGKPHDFFYKKSTIKNNKIRFVAVPTTFGTSSEITPYAVMTDKSRAIKVTLTDKNIFPDYAFIDPRFTLTMPKTVVAASCADLFSHAVEAYWNVNSTELTDTFSEQAIRIFLKYYKQTFNCPRNLKVREKISLASVCAGLAFSNTRTTACHSISYPLTTVFDIPHGIACILTLGEMLEVNSQAGGGKILKLCKIMDCSSVKEAKKRISFILADLDVKAKLRDYGLVKSDLSVVAKKGFTPEKMANNPYRITKKGLIEILNKIY